MIKANLARPFLTSRLEQWNYLDWVSNVGVRDLTFQLVLARLLVEDSELSRALSRLVDILTPSMVAEEDPLARRKQELLLNNVSIGGRLQLIVRARRALILHSAYFICHIIYELCSGWAHNQAVETCRHRLSTEVNINSNQHDCMVG